MKHDYTNDEIRDAWKDSVSLCEFLDAPPERPQASEADKALADLACRLGNLAFDPVQPMAFAKAVADHVEDLREDINHAQLVSLADARATDATIASLKEELANLTRRLQAAEHINEGYQAMEQKLEESQAELAALRQTIQPDAGISLGQVAFEAGNAVQKIKFPERDLETWEENAELHDMLEAAAQAVAAVVEARMIRRMEAVPVEELDNIYFDTTPLPEGDEDMKAVRTRLIAAAKGDGQAQAQPDTFEAHGKTYNHHTPGDPCPCDPEASVQCLTSISGPTSAGKATYFGWKVSVHDENHWGVIIGWRYADEPAQEEAISTEPEDKRLPPLNEADPVGHCAVEAARVHRKLDELGIPREEGGDELSLWGRVVEYAKAQQELAQLTGTQPVNLDEAWMQAKPWTPAVGDTVRLKSGGPVMTVYDIAKDKSFICCVHNTKGLCDYTTLPASCLTPAKP